MGPQLGRFLTLADELEDSDVVGATYEVGKDVSELGGFFSRMFSYTFQFLKFSCPSQPPLP